MIQGKSVKKKDFMYSIDQITVFPIGENYRVQLRGWAIDKRDSDSRVVLDGESGIKNIILEQARRADVQSRYGREYGDVTNCGFQCRFDCLKKEADKLIVRLYLQKPKSKERKLFLSLSLSELDEYLWKPKMECKIEDFYYVGGRIVAQGWAYASLADGVCRRPQIRIWNASGREVDFKINDVIRLDIEQMTGQPSVEGALGFRLEWQAKKDETYQVEFEAGHFQKKIAVNEIGMRRITYLGHKALRKGVRIAKRMLRLENKSYHVWEREHRVTTEEWNRQRQEVFAYMPKISIVVPAYRTPEKFLREMIDSVKNQSYENWELCIGDGSMDDSICGIIAEYAKEDERIKYKKLADNYGISGNTNEALKLANGDYLSLLDHDDLLTPDILYEVVKRINETDAEVLYTDEDKVTMDLKEYFEPHFKPDFNLDLLRSCNYICHFFVVKKNIYERVGQFREECNGSQDYDFILRCTSAANRVEHIAKILYHWRCHPNSTAGDPQSKMYCYEAGKRALELDLAAHGIEGAEVAIDAHFGYYRVSYPVDKAAKTAVIILPYGKEENIQISKEAVREHTPENCYDILVAEEEQGVSAAFNRAVEKTDADYLVFLQAGMRPLGDDWLPILLGNCQREEIGAVGATVLINDRYIAHSGQMFGVGDLVSTDFFAGGVAGDPGYAGRMLAQQNVRGLSWRGMMMKRSLFLEMGGFEESLQEMYMDADLCLKLQKAGKLAVYTPYTAFSMERISHHLEIETNDADEAFIRKKWREALAQEDPFYNRNFGGKGANFSLPF